MTFTVVAHHVRLEQRAFWRNPDYAFFTFVLPVGLLLLLGTVYSDDHVPGRDLSGAGSFVPGILAFGVIASAYANLAARIAVLRSEGVLKRIRATPLSPASYLAGQLGSTLVTTLLVSVATIALGLAVFGVAPPASGALRVTCALAAGIVCFAALGLAVSALIPTADAAGPVTNATYLPLAMVSGVFDPSMEIPEWLSRAVDVLPVKALADALLAGYDPAARGLPWSDLVVLGVWGTIGLALARRFFRWAPR